MSAQLKAVYELQKIDLALVKAQKMRAKLDDDTAKKQEVEAAKKTLDEVNKALHEASTEMQDKTLNLQSVESKRKKENDKLYGGKVTGSKELESIEKEVEMLDRQREKLDERILDLMDIVEERKNIVVNAMEDLKHLEEELAAIIEKRKHDDAVLVHKMKELAIMREKAAPCVDPIMLKRYEASRPRTGGVVFSKVVENSCYACHTQVMRGSLRALKADKELTTCENCGRILYLDESE